MQDLNGSQIAKKIHVSEASLTRFSQKCGFSGYREFAFNYKSSIPDEVNHYQQATKRVLADYEEILNKTYSLIDEEQINRVVNIMNYSEKVFFYGIGNSGLVAQEMKMRFMRLGLHCEALTDPDIMLMNSVLLDSKSLVIGLSISSRTPELIKSLKVAKDNAAKIILLTANIIDNIEPFYDELISVANRKNLNFGNKISPQLPLLVLVDIIYSFFSKSNQLSKKSVFYSTLQVLEENEGGRVKDL